MAQNYTNGITSLYFQPVINESSFVRQLFQTTESKTKEEVIIKDAIKAMEQYPFNISANNITNLEMKLENTHLTISTDQIISSSPIFIESHNSTLRIWNAHSSPHALLGTQGNTFVEGYDILDFNNHSIKCTEEYQYCKWNVSTINLISNITISGSGNNINIEKETNKNLNIKSCGDNKLFMKMNNSYDNLIVYIVNGFINFGNSTCENFIAEIKGLSGVNGILVNCSSDITYVGTQVLIMKRKQAATHKETINGPGKIIWTF